MEYIERFFNDIPEYRRNEAMMILGMKELTKGFYSPLSRADEILSEQVDDAVAPEACSVELLYKPKPKAANKKKAGKIAAKKKQEDDKALDLACQEMTERFCAFGNEMDDLVKEISQTVQFDQDRCKVCPVSMITRMLRSITGSVFEVITLGKDKYQLYCTFTQGGKVYYRTDSVTPVVLIQMISSAKFQDIFEKYFDLFSKGWMVFSRDSLHHMRDAGSTLGNIFAKTWPEKKTGFKQTQIKVLEKKDNLFQIPRIELSRSGKRKTTVPMAFFMVLDQVGALNLIEQGTWWF